VSEPDAGTHREITRRKLLELPGDWRAHFDLGLLELEQFRNLLEAQRLFLRAADLSPGEGLIWFYVGLTHFRMAAFEEAVKALRKSEGCGHRTAILAETLGEAHYNLGHFDEARVSFESALKRDARNPAVQAKLGLSTVRAEMPDKGLALLHEALSESPQSAELHEGLILAFVCLGRIEDAAKAADQKLDSIPDLSTADYLRVASLWAQIRNWTRSARALELGLLAYPGHADLIRARSEVTQAGGTPVMKSL
jgi:tetratricopeptide (TPR) repeat protein